MNRNRTSGYLLLIAMTCSLITLFWPGAASAAQLCRLTITNTTSCKVEICANGTCWSIPPGTTTVPINPCTVNSNTFQASICGTLQYLTLGQCCERVGAGGCCATICLSQPALTNYQITITPAGALCNCVC